MVAGAFDKRSALQSPGLRDMPTKRNAAKGPSQRQLRVGEAVRHSISELLGRREVHSDVLERCIVTIPEVRMSADLRIATVYVMPLGGGDAEAVIKALAANQKYIRGVVARAVNLKFAPELRFVKDASFDEGMRMDALLNSEAVRRDIESE
jgi:ribosome-binding factor A